LSVDVPVAAPAEAVASMTTVGALLEDWTVGICLLIETCCPIESMN